MQKFSSLDLSKAYTVAFFWFKNLSSFIAVSPCAKSPCRNGGKCIPTAGDEFTCQCTEGFQGEVCEKGNCSTIITYNYSVGET